MFSRIRKIFKEYQELKYLAYHDSLTGLLNRNWLFKNSINISQKFIYFIDVNNLKVINERGHTYGDIHLKKCVNDIKDFSESDDILVRYAGDEFILFSDYIGKIKSNKLYSVGFAENKKCVLASIVKADENMISNKRMIKLLI